MTVREILEKVRFKDLVGPLKTIEPRTEYNLYSYKQAFDLVRLLELKPSDGEVVDVAWDFDDYDNTPYLSASYHVRTDWEVMLSREVAIGGERKVSDEEAAAILLWEITFWGFSPQLEDEKMDEIFEHAHMDGNPFVAPYKKLQQRNHDLNCHPEDKDTEYYTLRNADDLFRLPKRNGPKRHRERRQTKRLEFLEKMMKRWDLQAKIISKSKLEGEKADLLHDEIMNSSSVEYHR